MSDERQIAENVRVAIRRRWIARLIADLARHSVNATVDVEATEILEWANRLDDLAVELRRIATGRAPRPMVPCDDCGVLSEDIATHRCRT